ncbi:MAG: glycine cleavage system protein GcvH [Verrucomicrobia bacterium]|nr:glycine cleavage system protein GcvH [Verrucomicrobiota bacterium]
MKYTESHEWITVKNSSGRVGISAYAQTELGDVVYIELPKVGQIVKAKEEVAILESTKAAADIYSPVSGRVTAVNPKLLENTQLLNYSPEQEGWLYEIALSDPSELDTLLDEEQYHQMIS